MKKIKRNDERILKKSQLLLRRTFDALQEAVFVIDAKTVQIIDCNSAASKMFGYSQEEMLGQTTGFLHIDEVELQKFRSQLFLAVKESGFLHLPEFHMRRKSGDIFTTDHCVMPLEDDDGEIIGWVSVVRDITERKRAEEALQLTRFTVDNAVDAVYWMDSNARIIDVNETASRMLGYTRQELLNFTVFDIDPNFTASKWVNAWETLKSLGKITLETSHRTKDGGLIPVEIVANYLRFDGRELDCAFARDITERKRSEEELCQTNMELRTANSELESFIYSVSHDLHAPLRSISGFAKLLIEDYADKLDEQGKDYLERMYRGGVRMSRLIEDLLELSRISRQEAKPTKLDISKIAFSIISELRESDPSRHVEINIAEGISAYGDERLIKVALTNLLGNAWKFTSKTENAKIELGVLRREVKTVYYVRDNGAGFDPQYREKMFHPFHRLHSEKDFEGTGIGLAIVERIIHRHGGVIWAEGEIGKGAALYFTLG